jgi:hypothetical protein
MSFTNNGKMYFSSNIADSIESEDYEIYCSEQVANEFHPPVGLDTAGRGDVYWVSTEVIDELRPVVQ